jgi:hypothetical protein
MMTRIAVILALLTFVLLPFAPSPVAAQTPTPESCSVIYVGSGKGPVSVLVPSWAKRLRAEVEWSGLQVRMFIDGTVYGVAMYGDPIVTTPYFSDGMGGAHTIKWGGIMLDYVGAWTLYACGSPPPPPPTPTPMPSPTPVQGPGCYSLVNEPAEWVSGTFTLYGPARGWYIVSVYEDEGASGAHGVHWRLERSGGYITPPPEDRYGNATFELRSGESATITITGADGPGVPGVWVAISAICIGMEATPIAPGVEDIQPVEFGVVEEGQECPLELPRVVFTFSPPLLPSFSFDFPGLRVCFRLKRLLLGWGDFNVMDWAIPLLTLSFVWTAWLSLRRG